MTFVESNQKNHFYGGEPTFEIEAINEIIKAHPQRENLNVQITTNGWFARNSERTNLILSQFVQINHLQLSFDNYHDNQLTEKEIQRLFDFCKSKKISTNISVTIENPGELLEIAIPLKNISTNIVFQKIEASGRAKQ